MDSIVIFKNILGEKKIQDTKSLKIIIFFSKKANHLMKQSIHPRASVWKDTQQYKEGTNPLAIHFENKAEPKPVGSVTKAFRATKNVTLQTG